jgi:HAMP domain-containing protein
VLYFLSFRRAKRLKKLNRMMQSTAAQQASNTWRLRTLVLLGILLVAHVACFAALTIQIDRRYQNAKSVSQIAELLAASQQGAVRANFMQVGATLAWTMLKCTGGL